MPLVSLLSSSNTGTAIRAGEILSYLFISSAASRYIPFSRFSNFTYPELSVCFIIPLIFLADAYLKILSAAFCILSAVSSSFRSIPHVLSSPVSTYLPSAVSPAFISFKATSLLLVLFLLSSRYTAIEPLVFFCFFSIYSIL